MIPFIVKVLIGCALGALIGYYGQCSSGTCPLTSTWWRGAIYGGVIGLFVAFITATHPSPETTPFTNTSIVKNITESEFDAEITNATTPVIVDFYAVWCGPCKLLAPIVDKQAEAFAGKIKFVKVDVDEAPGLAMRYQIQVIPALLFFKQGKLVDSVVGVPSEEALNLRLQSLSAAASTPPNPKPTPEASPMQ